MCSKLPPLTDTKSSWENLIEFLGGDYESGTKAIVAERARKQIEITRDERDRLRNKVDNFKKIKSKIYNLERTNEKRSKTLRTLETENKEHIDNLISAENEIYRLRGIQDDLQSRVNFLRNVENENYNLKRRVGEMEWEISNRNNMIRTFYDYMNNSQSYETWREAEELTTILHEHQHYFSF